MTRAEQRRVRRPSAFANSSASLPARKRHWPKRPRYSFLKKSGPPVWGGRGRRHQRAEREVILDLVVQAQTSGARLAAACDLLGISARTVERWRADPQVGDRRCGPRHPPSHALAPTEEARVVSVLTSSRYVGLSPKQLVPQLADEGLYLASESTMYRLPRRHGLRTKRRTTAQTHVTRASAVHHANGANQVWSWDITCLPTTVRGASSYPRCCAQFPCRRNRRALRVSRRSSPIADLLDAEVLGTAEPQALCADRRPSVPSCEQAAVMRPP